MIIFSTSNDVEKRDMPRPPAANKLTLLKHKRKLLVRAREIARGGLCLGWNDVLYDVRKEDDAGALTLKLWATATERDEIDSLCRSARAERKFK